MQEGATNREPAGALHPLLQQLSAQAINAADNRTSYYVMNQYWLMSDALMRGGVDASVLEIAAHFKYYGQMAHKRGQSFLLETAAGDLTRLVESSLESAPRLTDDLLTIVLDLDLEIRSETQEESLLGVRKAQCSWRRCSARATTRSGLGGSAATWPESGCPGCCA